MTRRYCTVYHDVLDETAAALGPGPHGVYVHLCRRANAAGVAWPSIEGIAKYFGGISPNTVRSYLKKLEACGLIQREPREDHAGGYQYRILDSVSADRNGENPSTIEGKRVQPLKGSGAKTLQPLNPSTIEPLQNLKGGGASMIARKTLQPLNPKNMYLRRPTLRILVQRQQQRATTAAKLWIYYIKSRTHEGTASRGITALFCRTR